MPSIARNASLLAQIISSINPRNSKRSLPFCINSSEIVQSLLPQLADDDTPVLSSSLFGALACPKKSLCRRPSACGHQVLAVSLRAQLSADFAGNEGQFCPSRMAV